MSRLAYPGIRWDKIARLAQSGISQGNDFRLSYRGISLQRHSFHKLHSSPQLAASRRPGLMTPLRPCPDDHVAPFLGLRDRPPMRGLPRPNCHSDGLTSYTLLPSRPSAAAASAVPNWSALPLTRRCCNLCGLVAVSLPFRNKGKSGTLPSIRSQGATYRMIGVGNC